MKMDKKTIYVPSRVISNYDGYIGLIKLSKQISLLYNTNITISFKNCIWFQANLVAVLGSIFDKAYTNGNTIKIKNLSPTISDILQRNQFLESYGFCNIPDINRTTISYQKFSRDKGSNFKTYIRENLLHQDDFPTLSLLAEKKINESIFELFENAYTHGLCDNIYTCGQYFPNLKPPRIDMTIVDLGVTISKNVNEHLIKFNKNQLSGCDAIEWALKKGNTTKTGDNPGGLGLDIIFEFVKLNKGKIQIVSSDGYWEYRFGKTKSILFDNIFSGTIVNIEFNIEEGTYYQMKEEVNLDCIF